MNSLAEAMGRLESAAEFAGAVITGSVRAFAVGADIAELAHCRLVRDLIFRGEGRE